MAGSYAYVADGSDGGLRIISISNPSSAGRGRLPSTPRVMPGCCRQRQPSRSWRAATAETWSSTSVPRGADSAGHPRHLWQRRRRRRRGRLAYVAVDIEGLVVFEFSDPDAPTRLGSHLTAGLSSTVAASGNVAYVGTWPPGLRVLDVSAPWAPVEVALIVVRLP